MAKKQKPVVIGQAVAEIWRQPPRTMMNLHSELGSTTIRGQKVRFCQHINGGCFWLSVGQDLYELSTEELMNSMLNEVMESRETTTVQEEKCSVAVGRGGSDD